MLIFGCREVECLLHTEKDHRPHLHHKPNPQLSPHQHQPYTMASSSSTQAVGLQPQAPAPQPQAPWLGPPALWSQNPSQWYSSDFRYTVRGAPWFSLTQPAPHTPAET